MARCKADTASGDRCKNEAVEGEEYCRVHLRAADSPARARRDDGDEAPPPPGPPDLGDPEPPVKPSALTAGGKEHGDDLPPPPLPPDVAGREEPPAPPPPAPPVVGRDRPDQTPEEVADEARTPPPMPDDPASLAAQADRGAPAPQVRDPLAISDEEIEEYIRQNRQRLLDELARERLVGLPQAMPTTALPTAPHKEMDGGVVALPGMTERTTQGQPPARVFFRSQGAEELKQELPDGRRADFKGGVYSTDDPDMIRMLRARIDKGRALFDEYEPIVEYKCPLCQFTSGSKGSVNSHIRTRHPGHEDQQL